MSSTLQKHLAAKQDQAWEPTLRPMVTTMELPGAGRIMLYQPTHPTAYDL